MHEKITAEHLRRLAIVYIRQSSMGQVKRNVESLRIQRRLVERAMELGWSEERILVLEGDLGKSASLPGQREDFEEVLAKVRSSKVGIIFGNDASRLARNNVDWHVLIHCCAFVGVLIGDESQVYDPSLPQDSLVLGIQGAMAAHESFALRKRMEQGLREKALRGELHQGFSPRGYIVVEGKHLRKHPDRRIQRAIAKAFEAYQPISSIYTLTDHLLKVGNKLPLTKGPGADNIEWVWPNYESLRNMLQNPKYAGIYAYPLTKVINEMSEDGQLKKRTVTVPREEWEIEILDNHPAYISVEQYEKNRKKMAMNASRYSPAARGAPQEGPSLITGLVYCRRCGHRMSVRYPSAKRITYACNKSRTRREGGLCGMVNFRANEIEERLSQSLLYTVSPAGVEAAQHAAQLLAMEWNDRRQVYLDAYEHECYKADLARRRFENVDPENSLVFETLAREYEEALRALEEHKAKLEAFDRDEPQLPTDEQKEKLRQLGQKVDQAWHHPRANTKLKKQIVRTLITHITADVDEETDEIILWVKWAGGHHTELREPRRQRPTRPKAEDLKAIIVSLAKVSDDERMARTLNRSRIQTERGETWTKKKVNQFRKRHDIPAFDAKRKQQEGWLTQDEAATYLEISPMSLNRLIDWQILSAERHPRLPSVVKQSDLNKKEVKKGLARIKSHGNSPLPENPDQLTLFR